MFGCYAMGLFANLPVALAPGMGINAYFTYSVVGFRGTGSISYEAALTAILIEGAIFLVLALTGVRYAIVRLVPEPVRHATAAAIGVFLAFIGLQTAEGIGVVVSDIATAVTLGACPPDKRTPIVAFTEECAADSSLCVISDAYTCDVLGGVMTSARTWVGILGLVIVAVMLAYKNRSAFICGIGFITFISWFRNTAITYFPYTVAGNARFEYFKQVVNIEPVNMVLAQFTDHLGHVGIALITFLYVDFLDTSGTLLGLAHSMGVVDEQGNFPRSRAAFSADAIATMFGSIFGIPPVTSYIESGAGVEAGARTGLTACICGFYFFLSIFFAPIIASIPPWATGGALIIVGALMCRSLGSIKWWDVTHAITAFLVVIIMPLTYSIAYGLIAGIGAYLLLHGTFWILACFGIPKPVFKNPDDFLPGPEDPIDILDDVKEGLDTSDDDEEAATSSAEASNDVKEQMEVQV
jgi:AGZA family xanthine/uracil permease-like MFS transporter